MNSRRVALVIANLRPPRWEDTPDSRDSSKGMGHAGSRSPDQIPQTEASKCVRDRANTLIATLSAILLQQRLGDRLPFLVERRSADPLPGAAVPVGGVAGVAFLAVQIVVHPVSDAALVGLRGVMRAVPVTLCVEPECVQRM